MTGICSLYTGTGDCFLTHHVFPQSPRILFLKLKKNITFWGKHTRTEDDLLSNYRAFRSSDNMFKAFVVLDTHYWLLVSCNHILG